MEQALAVRVLDRLVAAADEDAFESDNAAASLDGGSHGTRNTNAEQPGGQNGDAFGGGPSLSLAGRVKSNRRRSSSGHSLSVSDGTEDGMTPLWRRSALPSDKRCLATAGYLTCTDRSMEAAPTRG